MTRLAFKISGFSRPLQTKKINTLWGAVSIIGSFGVRIHWIRVDGRPIRVRFQEYPDSFTRGLQDS